MIDFFQHGSNIGFSISGYSGFLLLMYFLIEVSFFGATKTFLIHKLFIGLRVNRQVKKMLPEWWYIEKISYLTINKNDGFIFGGGLEYQVFIILRSKIPTGGHHKEYARIYGATCTTNDWIKVNWLGKIERQSFMASIFVEDKTHESQIKQWSRDNTLKKLGI